MTLIRMGQERQKHLITRGLPRDILRNKPFDLGQHTVTFQSAVDGMKPKKMLKTTQLAHFAATLEKPFAQPYLYIMGSSPNDGKAKQAAAYLMEHATKGQLGGKFPRSTRGRQTPLWHMVNGGYYDKIRDHRTLEEPSMLILSNVTVDSTNMKLEKLRDLLEMYNHIPRVVVVTGIDPLTFANTKLYLPVNHVLNIATARKVSL